MASPPQAAQLQPSVAHYQPPPTYPPPLPQASQVTDGRAASSLVFAILGLVFAIPLGLPGVIAGPIAYFLGRTASARIAESKGAIGGAGAARAGRILGIVTTAVGCIVTLLWLIVIFNAMLDTSSGG